MGAHVPGGGPSVNGEDPNHVRWFGESWGAPICDPDYHVPVPCGDVCLDCGRVIEVTDQGLILQFCYLDPDTNEPRAEPRAWHLDCFCDNVGIPTTRPSRPSRADLRTLGRATELATRGAYAPRRKD